VITICSLTRNKKYLHIPAQELTIVPLQAPHFDGLQVTSDYTVSIAQVTTQENGNMLTHPDERYKQPEAGLPALALSDLQHHALTPLHHHRTTHFWAPLSLHICSSYCTHCRWHLLTNKCHRHITSDDFSHIFTTYKKSGTNI
jgi:hypothetical protein